MEVLMYRYVIKFSNGRYRAGVSPSFTYFRGELCEMARGLAGTGIKILKIDVWRVKK